MPTKVTRRQLAAVLAIPAVAGAQTTPATPAPASAAPQSRDVNRPIPSNPAEELTAAQAQGAETAAALAKFDLPMMTEPAVHFRA